MNHINIPQSFILLYSSRPNKFFVGRDRHHCRRIFFFFSWYVLDWIYKLDMPNSEGTVNLKDFTLYVHRLGNDNACSVLGFSLKHQTRNTSCKLYN